MYKFICFAVLAVSVHGYGSGPPVGTNPDICKTMAPLHDVAAKTTTSPFEVVVAGSCYKEGLDIPVYVRVKSGEETYKYFEGLLCQARGTGDANTVNRGTFAASDEDLDPITCLSTANSAVGHNKAEHWGCKTFMWKAPSGYTADVKFYATVVKNKETYWVNVASATITYDAACTVDATTLNDACTAQASDDDNAGSTPRFSVFAMVLGLLWTCLLHRFA